MKPDALVLFSGGLDSILAARILMNQGLNVLGVHFTSPFFGNANSLPRWERLYKIPLLAEDIGARFVKMLRNWPQYGIGKNMNPCVDCKITQLSRARELMTELGAKFIATGEVIGQRPMSQRRDTLHLIQKQAGVGHILLRPLCARHLEPTQPELNGIVKRELLYEISGRGRNEQLTLARTLGLADIPSPGGGCRLAEKENSRRYWPVYRQYAHDQKHDDHELCLDFSLANQGRQLWRVHNGGTFWLCVGRNAADNQSLLAAVRPGDITVRLRDQGGPLALARHGSAWPVEILQEACAITASFAPRAGSARQYVSVKNGGELSCLRVSPDRYEEDWRLPSWDQIRAEIRQRDADARKTAR